VSKTELFVRRQAGGVFTVANESVTTGNIFWVDSGSSTGADATGYGDNPDRPFVTIDYAIGKCTADNGDVIYVMPGHSEEKAAAGALATFDVAGVKVIGLGHGESRPQFRWGHADAEIDVTADSVTLKNLVFISAAEDVKVMFDLDATDFTVEDCEFRDDATDENCIVYIDADDTDLACSRLTVRRCVAVSPDIANDHFIATAGDLARLTVEDCYISLGTNDGEAIIEAATGKDFTDCRIMRNTFYRLNTSDVVVMESDTTDNSGIIAFNVVGHADLGLATPWDVTGARLIENYAVGVNDASGLLLPEEDDDTE